MSAFLSKLGVRLDTRGAAARRRVVREGWPATASAGVRFHTTAKVQFRYREAGAGHSIVFAADPPMTLETYDQLIAVFAPHYRVIVLELPAMGFSVASEDFGFGFRETNEEVAAFLEAVAGDQAILAFSCVSGLGAIDIAVRYPALCSRLALIQTGDVAAFALWKARRDPRRILAKPILGQLAMQRLAPKRMPDWYALSVGQRGLIDGFCSCAAESFRRGAQWSLASAYQRYMDPHVTLERPSQPVLSLWGEADRSHPPENAHTIQRLAPDARCVSFVDLGHTPELEAPERVLAAIQAPP